MSLTKRNQSASS